MRTYAAGTTPYDASGNGGAITLSPTTPYEPFVGAFTNIPANVSRLVFEVTPTFSRAEVLGPSAVANVMVMGWRGLPARFSTFFERSDGAHQYAVEPIAASTTEFAMDVGAALLPWQQRALIDLTAGTFSARSHPGGSDGDLFEGLFLYRRTNGRFIEWTLFASKPGDLTIPVIPPEIMDMTPETPTAFDGNAFVFADDAIDGYADSRLDPYALVNNVFTATPGRRYLSVCAGCL